jgi:hypothetical protein
VRRRLSHHIQSSSILVLIYYTMRKSSLRRTTLFSLIGLSSTQSTSSWGQPFSVDNGATSSQVNLIPSSISPTSIHPIQSAVSGIASLDTASSTSLSGSHSGSSSPTGSRSSTSASTTGSRSLTSASTTASSAIAVQSTGAAVVGRQMGFAGVLAGAAGVLFV